MPDEVQAPPELDWSQWSTIETAASSKGPFAHYGIYPIRAVDRDGNPIPFPRLAAVDPTGTIYIGRSGYSSQSTDRFVSNRIREFKNKQHSGGQTYFLACIAMANNALFESHSLQVRACHLPDGEIDRGEDYALTQYLLAHGELPPCNSVMPKLKRMLF
jgi:hypothetical protein